MAGVSYRIDIVQECEWILIGAHTAYHIPRDWFPAGGRFHRHTRPTPDRCHVEPRTLLDPLARGGPVPGASPLPVVRYLLPPARLLHWGGFGAGAPCQARGVGGCCPLLRQARLWENCRGKGGGASDQSGGLPARAAWRSAVPRIAMPTLPQSCAHKKTVNSAPGSVTSGTRFNNEPIYGLTPWTPPSTGPRLSPLPSFRTHQANEENEELFLRD